MHQLPSPKAYIICVLYKNELHMILIFLYSKIIFFFFVYLKRLLHLKLNQMLRIFVINKLNS